MPEEYPAQPPLSSKSYESKDEPAAALVAALEAYIARMQGADLEDWRRVNCPTCPRRAAYPRIAARYRAGFPCYECRREAARARWAVIQARARERVLARRHRLPPIACDLAELAHLTAENGWVTRLHWRDYRGGTPAAADRHWSRLLRRLERAGIMHRSRLLPTAVPCRGGQTTSHVRAIAVDVAPQDVDFLVQKALRCQRRPAELAACR